MDHTCKKYKIKKACFGRIPKTWIEVYLDKNGFIKEDELI